MAQVQRGVVPHPMPRPPGQVGKRLLPDPEIASGWYNSVGKEKLSEKEKQAVAEQIHKRSALAKCRSRWRSA